MGVDDNNLVWIDLEMTGLDPLGDRIIEIATIITNAQLETLAEGPVLAIHQTDEVLAAMDDWNQEHHGRSGLIERVRASSISVEEAEQQTLAFVRQYVSAGISPLCGNSIGQDRRFLVRYMPELERYFHYRNLDVCTLKELVKRWAPASGPGPFEKNSSHQALDDIRASIEELRYYRKHFLTI